MDNQQIIDQINILIPEAQKLSALVPLIGDEQGRSQHWNEFGKAYDAWEKIEKLRAQLK